MFGENRRFVFFYLIMVLAVVFAGVMALSLGPANAQAGPLCFPSWDKLKAELDKAGEVQTSMGLVNETSLITVFESPEGDTWTMVIFDATGKACVIAGGTYWSQSPAPVAPVPGERDA